MAMHEKTTIVRENGERVNAMAPIVVSGSRATDLPGCYADWFLARLKKGYSAWRNPFNGAVSFVSYEKMRFIVFWSKNPKALLKNGILDWLEERGIGCYVQFTLNDYEREGLEKGIPPLDERIETFHRLAERLRMDGLPSGVVWRFDPMMLADEIATGSGVRRIGVDDLLAKAQNIGDQLKGFAEKMVFSYADISGAGAAYAKVQKNLCAAGVKWREFDHATMRETARRLSKMNVERGWNFTLATCGERIGLEEFGVTHNKCVDDELMVRRGYRDVLLMQYLGVEVVPGDLFGNPPEGAKPIQGTSLFFVRRRIGAAKDKGQREACGCVASKDIGQYDTCPHLCAYCYANTSAESAMSNWSHHLSAPEAEMILGDVK